MQIIFFFNFSHIESLNTHTDNLFFWNEKLITISYYLQFKHFFIKEHLRVLICNFSHGHCRRWAMSFRLRLTEEEE